MKRTSTVLCIVLSFLTAAGAARAQSQKIGVFDAGRLSAETDLGKAITARLNDLQDKKKSELQAKGKEMQSLQNQLDTQGLSLSAEKRLGLEKEIQRKSLELSQAQEAARSELQLEYGEEQEKFQQKIAAVLDQFSRHESFTIILERSAVAFADPSIDVTTALVDRFNQVFAPTPGETPKPDAKPDTKPDSKK